MARRFGSAAAFKASLEAHLRRGATERSLPLQTVQLRFVMQRLLARLFHEEDPPWLLKGGYAMDLRYRPRARTTKDLDLSVPLASPGPAGDLRDQLQAAADRDLGDHLVYRIGEPKSEFANAPGGGRYPCEAVLLGKASPGFLTRGMASGCLACHRWRCTHQPRHRPKAARWLQYRSHGSPQIPAGGSTEHLRDLQCSQLPVQGG